MPSSPWALLSFLRSFFSFGIAGTWSASNPSSSPSCSSSLLSKPFSRAAVWSSSPSFSFSLSSAASSSSSAATSSDSDSGSGSGSTLRCFLLLFLLALSDLVSGFSVASGSSSPSKKSEARLRDALDLAVVSALGAAAFLVVAGFAGAASSTAGASVFLIFFVDGDVVGAPNYVSLK